ncbi:MAG: ABC transporter ATP-binding protein [Deltaproteobacteria bacterium]|nr:ABC transporter ATP-binding protein [Deltaproteobacteria bacterium]
MLRASGLRKSYGGGNPPAVDDLSLQVEPGEVYGLLGPNGAGKTTSILIMSTLLRPCYGTLSICGTDAFKYPGKVRKMIGLVPQEIALYPTLTGRENLYYFGRLNGLKGASLEARVDTCIGLVGLSENADRRVEYYSGGMKRRLNLAVGVVHQPKLLFLDEPTVGIDAQSRHMIIENLLQLREEGVSMVYTTHYMEEAQQLCNNIAIIDKGKKIAEGAAGQLLAAHPGCRNLEELFLHFTGRQLRD